LQTNNNNNNKEIRPKKFNVVFDSQLKGQQNQRYCVHCHIQLINNPNNTPFDKDIYFCPQCGVRYGIKETEPGEKLRTNFPSFLENQQGKHIFQSANESMSRSKYFVKKRAEEKNAEQSNDPYLKYMRYRSNIQIRDIDYYNPDD